MEVTITLTICLSLVFVITLGIVSSTLRDKNFKVRFDDRNKRLSRIIQEQRDELISYKEAIKKNDANLERSLKVLASASDIVNKKNNMSEESVLSFRKLVSAMRTTEKEYWAHRDKKMLHQSIELEKRVDGIIMKADRNDVPQNDNGKFFLLVAELRASTIQYFQEKKKLQPDKELVNSLFKTIKEKEAKIDKMLIRLKDEQIKKDGYIIQYHVMERMPRAHQARSIFNSSDEQLANIELNDHYRHPDPPGTMYFICKEYLGKNGKQLPHEELDKIINNNLNS